MKRILEIYSFVLVCLVFFMAGRPGSVVASQQAQEFLGGIRHYESKAYGSAIEAFSKLVEKGVRNGKLYYNLANAYLKNGDIGPAILWYERALKLLPNDPDVRFNLTYADTLATDKKESFASPLMTVMFFWKDLFSPPPPGNGSPFLCNAIFWGFWGAWFWFRKRGVQNHWLLFFSGNLYILGYHYLPHMDDNLPTASGYFTGIRFCPIRFCARIDGVVCVACRYPRSGRKTNKGVL